MCRQQHPLYRRGSNISDCELSFLSHSSLQNKCVMKPTKDVNNWIQLLHPNQWIYFWPKRGTANAICNAEMSQITIEGAGILSLPPGCIIKTETTTIQAHKLYPSTFKTSFIPTRNLSEIITVPKQGDVLTVPNITGSNYHKQFAILKQRLEELTTKQSLEPTLQGHDVHQFAIGYLAILLIIIIIIYFVVRKWQPSCNSNVSKRRERPIAKTRVTTTQPRIPLTRTTLRTVETSTLPEFKLEMDPNGELI